MNSKVCALFAATPNAPPVSAPAVASRAKDAADDNPDADPIKMMLARRPTSSMSNRLASGGELRLVSWLPSWRARALRVCVCLRARKGRSDVFAGCDSIHLAARQPMREKIPALARAAAARCELMKNTNRLG